MAAVPPAFSDTDLHRRSQRVLETLGRSPCLAALLVGGDPGSVAYAESLGRSALRVGVALRDVRMDGGSRQEDVECAMQGLGADPSIDGVLPLLPLPARLDKLAVLELLPVEKDVDGQCSLSQGRVVHGNEALFVSCTARGVLHVLESLGTALQGSHAVIVNRTPVVGRPLAQLLLNRGATVTVCSSSTRDLAALTRQADVLVSAAGQPGLIAGDMVKEGAVVVDVGCTFVGGEVIGDVAYSEVAPHAAYLNKAGSFGPAVTVYYLLNNVITAAERSAESHR
eukprot:m51a1_g9028 putative bifunctional -methylene-tetrahydrofolate dehydrogenase -methylene-tetrahydrofolate cyclohydrolase (282) ;mRNA; r:216898-217815